MVTRRFDVWLVDLDPTVGSEIRKTRPAVIISPDEMNTTLRTVIVAPMTTKGLALPCRVPCQFQSRAGQIVLDQIRTLDKQRLHKRLGSLEAKTGDAVLDTLTEMFVR